ncbi:MAG: DNA ligase D [Actinobacteria bacterium]|nr:MAG: DNA ligase D [Actinomycetota bacterium]
MALEEYRKKRHFEKTPEPAGKPAPGEADHLFVIHKHAARRLHYDLRLQLGGTLKSWAVPKGPSLDPADKRLAVHVEDHPIEYAGFEGVIPPGEYGAGTVEVWDRGRWQPEGDARQGYEQGKMSFRLDGEKLHGKWALVRMRRASRDGKENWLFIKEKDEEVRTGKEADIVGLRPESAASGRTLEEISAEAERVWRSAPAEGAGGEAKPPDPSSLPRAKKAPPPRWQPPQLATLVEEPPRGEAWLHEIKFDGYRIVARLEDGDVGLYSRRDIDWTGRFPSIAGQLKRLPAKEAMIDGEVVALEPDGRSSFGLLQDALSKGDEKSLFYFCFDLLYLDGYDLTDAPLARRKEALRRLLGTLAEPGRLRYTDHITGEGDQFFRQACGFGLEGVLSKKAEAPRKAGRGRDWLKVKCLERQEFVIGGYTDPAGSRVGFGALLIGVHDERGRLVFSGKVGTGFNERVLRELGERLRRLEQKESPFANEVPRPLRNKAHWVRPELVAEVAFTEWTKDGMLRHPSFQGIREDKHPGEVVREEPLVSPKLFPPREIGPQAERPKRAAPRLHPAKPEGEGRVAGVRLTHPDRIYYPEEGITKIELATYYEEIREWIMPYVSNRPLTMVRCPEGWRAECFFQKQATGEFPDFIKRIKIEFESTRSGEKQLENAYVDSLQGLIYLVQMGVLEFHTWCSSIPDIERPDRMVFDLDPSEDASPELVVEATLAVRNRLVSLGLESFLQSTGGKGYHVVVPISPRLKWDDVEAFAKALAQDVVTADPTKYTAMMSKAKRRGRVFVDYLRTTRGATAIAAYSARRKPGAPVATPLSWDELSSTPPNRYTVRNIRRRLAHLRRDPWELYDETERTQAITRPMRSELGV